MSLQGSNFKCKADTRPWACHTTEELIARRLRQNPMRWWFRSSFIDDSNLVRIKLSPQPLKIRYPHRLPLDLDAGGGVTRLGQLRCVDRHGRGIDRLWARFGAGEEREIFPACTAIEWIKHNRLRHRSGGQRRLPEKSLDRDER